MAGVPGSTKEVEPRGAGDTERRGGGGGDSDNVSLVVGADHTVIEASEEFCHLIGRRRDEVVGHSPLDFTHPDDVEASRRLMDHSHRQPGKASVLEKRYTVPGGEIVTVRLTAMWHATSEAILAYVTDITEIATLRRRHNVLIESSADAILVIDRYWVVTDLNQAAREMVGPIGTNLWDLLAVRMHPEDLPASFKSIEHAYSSPGLHHPITFRAGLGNNVWFHYSATVNNLLADPAIRGVVINVRNVTAEVTQLAARRENERAMGRALVEISELSDPFTAGHQRHAAEIAERIASRMSLDARAIADIALAASLHDIGKAGIPTAVLSKPAPLAPDELALVRSHCEIGHRILTNGGMSVEVTEPVLHHHERIDGSGYPDGLAGDEVSLASQIVAVADAIDAASADRPYRSGLGANAVVDDLKTKRCTLYRSDVVDAALDVLGASRPVAEDANFLSPG